MIDFESMMPPEQIKMFNKVLSNANTEPKPTINEFFDFLSNLVDKYELTEADLIELKAAVS